jgi:hypothetical protein
MRDSGNESKCDQNRSNPTAFLCLGGADGTLAIHTLSDVEAILPHAFAVIWQHTVLHATAAQSVSLEKNAFWLRECSEKSKFCCAIVCEGQTI